MSPSPPAPCPITAPAPRRSPVRASVSLAAVVLGVALTAPARPPLLVNQSSSLPRGVYLRAPWRPIAPGAIVALDPPPAARAYLAGLGYPPDARLLKRVAAGPGARVCARAGMLQVGAARRRVLARDRRGAPLPGWAGCRRLRPGEYLLLGDTPGSFDGRYFGPVRLARLEGPYRPVWRW